MAIWRNRNEQTKHRNTNQTRAFLTQSIRIPTTTVLAWELGDSDENRDSGFVTKMCLYGRKNSRVRRRITVFIRGRYRLRFHGLFQLLRLRSGTARRHVCHVQLHLRHCTTPHRSYRRHDGVPSRRHGNRPAAGPQPRVVLDAPRSDCSRFFEQHGDDCSNDTPRLSIHATILM